VGSAGDRVRHAWLLGSVAERVSQIAANPVLVVRDDERLAAWARGEHTLELMVGVELTEGALQALRFALQLAELSSTKLTVAEIAWPASEQPNPDAATPMPLDRLEPALERELLARLHAWAAPVLGTAQVEWVVSPGFGRVDSHLTQLAAARNADLLVVGTHQRSTVARLWLGSVSRGVLHGAAMSVACVPKPGA
jgi:nucleotide-binding universal stress UspA family protein